ncbi:PAS domain-containing protein [Paracoccus indicus]|uniref:PAS domain-containing protein n=1 Tax=Paracoccus indicus TaxID=2079229 RepID=UPI001FE371D8|nr:PAS domain-containing protein [Paracoccus indicus]
MPDRDDTKQTPTGKIRPLDAGRVLQMQDYEGCNPDRTLRDIRAYWHGLRKGRAVPARTDVDPRGIARALDYAFILERIAPGAGRLRLAGRHLIDLMGMEVRGMPICAFLNTSSRGRFSDVLESVFKAPQIAQLTLAAKPEYARPELKAQMLLLPLRSDLGDVTRALGCLIATGETGVAPRRFDLIGDEVMPVIEGGATLAPSPSAMGFAEGAQDFTPAPPAKLAESTPEERRAMFRVVTPRPPSGDQG